MFKNSHSFLKISSIFYFSYLDDSNKLAKGIGKFGRVDTLAQCYVLIHTLLLIKMRKEQNKRFHKSKKHQ